jgi:hypothetical protein
MTFKHLPFSIILCLVSLVVSFKDLTKISDDVPQDVSAVFSFSQQAAPTVGKHPRIMFTLEPAHDDEVTISTCPKDLVTFDRSGSRIHVNWNDDVAKAGCQPRRRSHVFSSRPAQASGRDQ